MISYLSGDCRHVLQTIPARSVHCCVTSPPYWGLRDYATDHWEGGASDCSHDPGNVKPVPQAIRPAAAAVITAGGSRGARRTGRRCGAVRVDAQLGLEETPEEYVANLVKTFRQVRRVLRDDGTVWLNLGDTYAGGGRKARDLGRSRTHTAPAPGTARAATPRRLKPKDLVGIPWRVAFALQADGWYLRSDVIWHKPNAMPESAADRPTRCHEYLFLLTKRPHYYYDAAAIREPWADATAAKHARSGYRRAFTNQSHGLRQGRPIGRRPAWVAVRSPGYRNKRSVWTVGTQSYRGAHFAVFPPELIRPCVRAGCAAGGTVLDPFGGSGTTALVAQQEGRDAILIELNPRYVALQRDRTMAHPACKCA
jgi:DNA modification methylase